MSSNIVIVTDPEYEVTIVDEIIEVVSVAQQGPPGPPGPAGEGLSDGTETGQLLMWDEIESKWQLRKNIDEGIWP